MLSIAAAINILLTFALIGLGAFVQSQNLGLECVEWPICYQADKTVAFSSYSMIHRCLAGLVVLINIGLIFWARKNQRVDLYRTLRVGLFLLITQSALGALSVFYKFPTIVSVAHLFLSVGYILVFSNILHPKKIDIKLDLKKHLPYAKVLIGIIIFLVGTQFFLGATLAHSVSKSVCGLGLDNPFTCLEPGLAPVWWPNSLSARVHMSHRFLGMLTFALIAFYLIYSARFISFTKYEKGRKWLRLTMGLVLVSAAQFPTIKNLFLIDGSNTTQIFHLMYGVLTLIILLALLNWYYRAEEASFGDSIPTLVGDLFSLTKPRLGLLVVATVVSGVLISGEFVNFFNLVFALVLTTLIVMSATTLNCWMEKDVDALMDRTKGRALPAGRVKMSYALAQGVILLLISIPLTVKYVNLDTALLGLAAWAIYLFAYTPLKRISPTALYVGAIPGAIPPVMGRTIVVGEIDAFAWILFAVLFVWQLPHFMAISIYHDKDYKAGGIIVYPHVLSPKVMKVLMVLLTALLVVCSVLPYFYNLSSLSYLYVSSILGGIFFIQCCCGFLVKTERAYVNWARQYFWGSIIYLPLLMAAMIFLS